MGRRYDVCVIMRYMCKYNIWIKTGGRGEGRKRTSEHRELCSIYVV